MQHNRVTRILSTAGLLAVLPLAAVRAQETVFLEGMRVTRADISPPLRSLPTRIITDADCGLLLADPGDIPEQTPGTETPDPLAQDWTSWLEIPAPTVSFDGPPNLCGCSPPDPNGAVGPNHFVAMDNLHYAIYDKSGTLLLGPTATNMIWAGFGGECQNSNDGDPVVLYDQLADRWLLTQFAVGSPDFLCVALSTTGDPTGSYQRYEIVSPLGFPDYPKWGLWPDGYYASARNTSPEQPLVWAMDRLAMLGGSLSPTIVGLAVTPGSTPAYNYGNGLLPSDLDGFTLPPAGSPNYFIGSMDDGGGLGAPQDALSIWEFHADFVTPGNSTFTLTGTVPFSPYDSIFPCSGRLCIPQPATTNRIDHLGYRQRPLHRAAYRNFGSHESIVTNQSVEAGSGSGISGIRWWELRDPGGMPTIFQEGTYAPGLTDGIHRWMGSIAMDSAGNMALGYSAADDNSPAGGTFPSLWYTGRLVSDPPGVMAQGEASFVDGTGSQTSSQRWGDYTSMVVDPTDDCTFWYTNEYIPTTSGAGWNLRIGAFRFAECGSPDFTISPDPLVVQVCQPDNAVYTVNVGSISGFTDPVTLGATGNPGGTSVGFSVNPVTPPGASTMTISGTAGAAAGSYTVTITGTSGMLSHSADVGLDIFAGAPAAPTLLSPPNGSGTSTTPTLVWSAVADAVAYLVEVDDDPGFGSPEFTTTTAATSVVATGLASNTTYSWRVTGSNVCGTGASSTVFTFTTAPAPGDCATGTTPNAVYEYGFESGAGGWTVSGSGASNWTISGANPHSGTMSYFANDIATVSDQRLESPDIALPTGQSPLTFQFWNDQALEDAGAGSCFDGGIIEISTNGGSTWTQLTGPALLTDPYDGVVSSSFSNPLAGLNAWCGDPQPYLNSVVDVDAYAGQTVRFRLRLGTDSSVSHPGWYVDDVKVQSCVSDTMPFLDGFETGDTSRWSSTVP